MEQEKRYFDRRPLKLPLLISSDKAAAAIDAETRDLGAKGLGITSKDMIPSEGEIKLKVEVPGQRDFLSLLGNVVWSREYFPDGWRAGIALKEQSINLVTFSVLEDMLRNRS